MEEGKTSYKCSHCDSSKVGQMGYVNLNDNKMLDTFEPTTFPEECYQCFDCDRFLQWDEITQTSSDIVYDEIKISVEYRIVDGEKVFWDDYESIQDQCHSELQSLEEIIKEEEDEN
tara:strand:+ start:992 stop:1339 length:348 start_codon:yes stop_codon:yes gene_type:complete